MTNVNEFSPSASLRSKPDPFFLYDEVKTLDLHDGCDTLWQMRLGGVAERIHMGNTGTRRS
jgi:hypothetical protein